MNDIVSDLCNLPTGVFALEFLPSHEITGWVGGVPTPSNRWYGIRPLRDSLTYGQPTEKTAMGPSTSVAVGCLVINDSQAVANQLDAMERMRFVLRVTHYDGKVRIVGAPEQYCDLVSTEYTPEHIVGAQGYKLNFAGVFSARPMVV